MHPARHIKILDTTLRDGEQTEGVSFAPAEKLNMAKALLGQLKVDRIEVASARVSHGEQEAVARIVDWAGGHGFAEQVEVLGFIDNGRSVDWVYDAGGQVINLLCKGSRKHCEQQLRKSQAEHLEDVRRAIDYAQVRGLGVNLYLEDWSNGFHDSPNYVFAMMEGLEDIGVRHFMLPDTLGVLTPDQVYNSLSEMIERFPWARFDFHPHNDYGLATANALMAAQAGVASIHCTINCLGERAGNASLAEVVVNLRDRLGLHLGVDETHLVTLSRLVETFSGKRMADNAPVVGNDVFTQTSGIHADGDRKGGLYQTALTPERFARQRSYALGKMSGKASLQKNLEQLDINLSPDNFQRVLERVIELGDSKKRINPEDLPFIIAEVLESREYDHIALRDCTVTSGLGLISTASIKIELHSEELLGTGQGNGGFDAFMNAITTILKRKRITVPELIDYEIRIPRGGQTSALTECTITWKDERGGFKTRGVHANQVFAAMHATIRMLNLQLQRRQEEGGEETPREEP